MKIYYEDNHIIVVEKKVNQPTQEDESGDFDVLSEVKDYIKKTYNKPGNVYVGLVHRLDRPVGGVMVFAKTSKAASRLSDQVRTHQFQKTYVACVMGQAHPEVYRDYMIKNRKTNTSSVVGKNHPEAKYAELAIIAVDYFPKENLSRIHIALKTGRSHQIRVQCAHHGLPLWGDARYNPRSKPGQQIALWAQDLSFYHPTTKEKMTFSSHLPSSYPFTL